VLIISRNEQLTWISVMDNIGCMIVVVDEKLVHWFVMYGLAVRNNVSRLIRLTFV